MKRRARGAFTLVELLVVASIMALLFGMVIAAGQPNTSADVRRGAQQLASVLVAAQSRAIGSPAGAGVILESDGTGAILVSNADVMPFVTGRVASGLPPAPAATTASISLDAGSLTADAADLAHGYKVQFFTREAPGGPARPPTAWLSFTSSSPPAATVGFRTANGQTDANTIWPPPPRGVAAGGFEARVARYPQRAERVLELPKGAAIDLRFSGCGDPNRPWNDSQNTWGGLANKGAIAICFDSVGGIDAVMQRVLDAASARGVQPVDPSDPIYLFVVPREELANPAANTLASDVAVWVAVRPQSGQVTISANVPQSGSDATAVRQARQKARSGIPLGK